MVKEMFEKDVEAPLTPRDYPVLMSGRSLSKSFWGQLSLMGICMFFLWMFIFSLTGYMPPQAYLNVTFKGDCLAAPPQVNQTVVNPEIKVSGIFVANFFPTDVDNLTMMVGEEQLAELSTKDGDLVEEDAGESDPVAAGRPNMLNDEITNALIDALATSLTQSDPNPIVNKYYVSEPDEKLNWFEALQVCIANNMQLLAIESLEKDEEILAQIIGEGSPDEDFWTSGTNLWTPLRNRYVWASTGQDVHYTNWHDKNPNAPNDQNCIQITRSLDSPTQGSYRWNDYGCHIPSRFICEVV